jgi:hypothetical protein
MSDDTTAGQWDKEQLRIDDEADDPLAPTTRPGPSTDPSRDEPGWNKGQMAIDDAGEAQPRYDPDTMAESETGPTGGRSNPGGGERFGEIDDTKRRR